MKNEKWNFMLGYSIAFVYEAEYNVVQDMAGKKSNFNAAFKMFGIAICKKTKTAERMNDPLTWSVGPVSKPQAKNSRNITTVAWYTLGLSMPST